MSRHPREIQEEDLSLLEEQGIARSPSPEGGGEHPLLQREVYEKFDTQEGMLRHGMETEREIHMQRHPWLGHWLCLISCVCIICILIVLLCLACLVLQFIMQRSTIQYCIGLN